MAKGTTDLRAMKREHVEREYDRARSYAERRGTRIDIIRGWNVTVIGAYVAWMVKAGTGDHIPVLPLPGVICLFWIMEAFATADVLFSIKHTTNRVDSLFDAKTVDEFNVSLGMYRFMNEVGGSQYKQWWSSGGKVDRFSQGLLNCQTGVFYFAPIWILFSIYYLPWRHVPSCCVLVSVIVFVTGPIVFVFASLLRGWVSRRVSSRET